MSRIHLIMFMLTATVRATPVNATVTISNDQSQTFFNHGDPRLVCTRASPISIAVFLFVNYIAHCATVGSYPGYSSLAVVLTNVFALFFPASGIIRAMNMLIRRAELFGENELETAARAGALCMVVRTSDWEPRDGDIVQVAKNNENSLNVDISNSQQTGPLEGDPESIEQQSIVLSEMPKKKIESVTSSKIVDQMSSAPALCSIRPYQPEWLREPLPTTDTYLFYDTYLFDEIKLRRRINGTYALPDGYKFAFVPSDAKVGLRRPLPSQAHSGASSPLSGAPSPPQKEVTGLCSSYSFPRVALALVQTLSAGVTLYKARGEQISKYGYAAFGLTVIPYLIMSIVNLIAQLLTPEYPKLFMIWSPEMEEARGRKGYFDSVIGSLCPSPPDAIAKFEVDSDNGGLLISFLQKPEEEWDLATNPFVPRGKVVPDSTEAPHATIELPVCARFELERRKMKAKYLEFLNKKRAEAKGETASNYVSRRLHRNRPAKVYIAFLLGPILVIGMSLVAIGVLTHFRPEKSTVRQRAWTLSWLVVGMTLGLLAELLIVSIIQPLNTYADKGLDWSRSERLWTGVRYFSIFSVGNGVYFAPAIGGFIVVIQMLKDYGSCIKP